MPNMGFKAKKEQVLARRQKDMGQMWSQTEKIGSEFGAAFFNTRLIEAAKKRDVAGLVQLRAEVKAAYRSALLRKALLTTDLEKTLNEKILEQNRDTISSINAIISKIQAIPKN